MRLRIRHCSYLPVCTRTITSAPALKILRTYVIVIVETEPDESGVHIAHKDMQQSHQDTCLKGFWQDGVCVCQSGSFTLFYDWELHPAYCNHNITDYIPRPDSNHILSYISITVSLAVD